MLATLVTALAATDDGRGLLPLLGRFHPAMVHLPIGVLAAVALLEARALLARERTWPGRGLLLGALAAATALAAASGWFLAAGGGDYAADELDPHRLLGFIAVGLTLAAAVLHPFSARRWVLPALRLTLLATLVVVVLAGRSGGVLTHGPSWYAGALPSWLGGGARPAPLPPPDGAVPRAAVAPGPPPGDPPAPAPSWSRDIRPILDARCIECHGASKQKAGLRLDSAAAVLAGAKKGAVVVAGHPERSPLALSIALPADDPDIMPPKGEPLTAAQIALIQAWIAAGAPVDEAGAVAAPVVAAAPAGDGWDALAAGVARPDPALVQAIIAAGGSVLPLDRDGRLVEVVLAHTPQPVDAALVAQVARLGASLAWLDARGSAFGDALLAPLRDLPNLRRLNLARTAVGDAGCATIAAMPALEWLNLVDTRIGDVGAAALARSAGLRRVHLAGSAVGAEAVAALRAALPAAVVDDGRSTR